MILKTGVRALHASAIKCSYICKWLCGQSDIRNVFEVLDLSKGSSVSGRFIRSLFKHRKTVKQMCLV